MWASKVFVSAIFTAGIAAGAGPVGVVAQDSPPPLPSDVPVLLVGSDHLDGSRLHPYEDVRLAMGRAGKAGPLGLGETIDARAITVQSLRREQRDGDEVWVRSFSIQSPADGQEFASGEIVLDLTTLTPISSHVSNQGNTTDSEYDWNAYVVRQGSPDLERDEWTSESLDLRSVEAAAHETWLAALPLELGYRVMIPAILAGGGGKWWTVPHVVGSEEVDIGDGVSRSAWVVEIDWWGMGAGHSSYTPGGGINGSGGTGGKYWVLKEAVPGLPLVVRIRTEMDADNDSVIQLQAETGEGP